MLQPIKSKLELRYHRLSGMAKAFVKLYTLPKEKVNAFLDAYDVFQQDWRDEEKLRRDYGDEYYTVAKGKIADWYSVLNLLLTLGSVEKMYVPPAMKINGSIHDNQLLFEEKMIKDLEIKKDDRVLDIGCGRGRIAANVQRQTGAHVTGFNIDQTQIDEATENAKRLGLEDKMTFVQHDMNDHPLPFEDNSFDAIYHVQAFSYAKDLTALMKEVNRILKPGGKFSSLDYVLLPNYNPDDPHHVDLVNRTKPLLGAVGSPTVKEYEDAYKAAGFELLTSELPSKIEIDAPTIEKASTDYTRIHNTIRTLTKFKILPSHIKTLFDAMTQNVDAFLEVDKMKIVSTNYQFVGQKKP